MRTSSKPRRRILALGIAATIASLSVAASRQASQPASTRGALATGVIAVRHVSVIPMTADIVLGDATVIARDGRIVAVGPTASTTVPRGARIIEGAGKFLIPGLADMHVHLLSDGDEVDDSAGPAELAVMLANGVTAARLMIGTPEQLALRRDVAAGRIVGPQLWVASPQLTGRASENALVVTTPNEAREAVRRAASEGYDFVKLTLYITPEVFDAVVDEAKIRGIRVVGHVDPAVGVRRALEAHEQIEHLDGYLEAVLAESAPTRESLTQMNVYRNQNWASMDFIDDRKIGQIAGETARAGIFVNPTQNVFNTSFGIGESDSVIRNRPDWHFWPPKMRAGYLRAHANYWDRARWSERTDARQRRYVEVRNKLVKAIHDSGGRIMAGSDTPEWFHMYGWGLHRELQALVRAGLTPYQALAAATTRPAEFLGASAEWGTIERGKRADFVLLSANPLTDIRNSATIDAVAIGGRWTPRAQLDAMIARGVSAVRVANAQDSRDGQPTGTIVVSNMQDNTVTLVDAATGRAVATLPTGQGPHEVATSHDGRWALVSNYGGRGNVGSTITVIDVAAKSVARTIDLGQYRRPHGMAFFPGDSLVAVTSEASRVVLVLGFADGAVRRTLPTNGRGGHMLAMASLGNRLVVGNIADATIALIDPADTTKTRLIKVGRQPEGVAISPDGQTAWAGSNQDSIVVVVDLRSEQHVDTLRGFGLPYRIAISPDGRRAVISDPVKAEVRIYDAMTRRLATTLHVPNDSLVATAEVPGSSSPEGVAISRDSRFAFVTLQGRNRVVAIDLSNGRIVSTGVTGTWSDGVAWSSARP